ncbi:MAG: hypothetical protein D4S01_05585 [Dehalococcoidia bacterium]|nr:MAG: hypothetical protein D4S01_05585 [Dehalococcoidia bacterium]
MKKREVPPTATSYKNISTDLKNFEDSKPFNFNRELKRLRRKVKYLEQKCILDGWVSAEEFMEITRKVQQLMIKATETNQNRGNQH